MESIYIPMDARHEWQLLHSWMSVGLGNARLDASCNLAASLIKLIVLVIGFRNPDRDTSTDSIMSDPAYQYFWIGNP